MNPREALNKCVKDLHGNYKYIPDSNKEASWIEQLLQDYFETEKEFEEKGGADCDGFSICAIQRGYKLCEELGSSQAELGIWRLVLGTVKQQGIWLGHAWVELIDAGERLWADPTWGVSACDPMDLGYPDIRKPKYGYQYTGIIFEAQVEYNA